MTYHYENLGDERFQHLALSILSAKFPNVQCLPVGQPDGGRDAFQTRFNSKRTTIVFQVKYTRNPANKDERTALEELIKTESRKVEGLKTKGLRAYYMISNVSGTSHPEVGSIDRVNELLTSTFGVESHCLWRDDLDALLNNLPAIKWSFPDILKGTDILQFLVEKESAEISQNRKRAVHSYVASQYQDDREVRFKQADIQNKIVDLFVDLPMKVLAPARKKGTSLTINLSSGEAKRTTTYQTISFRNHFFRAQTAAEAILNAALLTNSHRIVIEGAPGQGKSTITQYACQVHRIRILAHNSDLALLPKTHAQSLLRLPFRVDLRDYATWVGGRNPYAVNEAQQTVNSISLESFLSTQVSYLSGGLVFSPSDFLFIARSSPVCMVLDGFDEIADITVRKRVVSEITQCSERLLAHGTNLQIIVTSRPAAFANSPGFPVEEWTHYELQDLTDDETKLYTQKWMTAKSLPHRERQEFKRQVEEKLKQPHMQELARNPMQLTILLSLIMTRGFSLPDKRTAVYDSYMDTFFNREAEKSRIVRDRRDILVAIHRYLAWELHTKAESEAGTGSISERKLKELLRDYLFAQGYDPSMVEELFTGMIERVVALVSRVQGTYEFEVQPLREYFAGRFLYETAPYCPPGVECKGTKPERFDALERNFYWLNVTRFYAGCYSVGELSSLADGLISLSEAAGYRLLSHPTMLTTMLLSDYVFAQQPNVVRRVVSSIYTRCSIIVLACVSRTGISLPEGCGRSFLAEAVYGMLSAVDLLEEHRTLLLRVVTGNTALSTRTERWKKERSEDTSRWLSDGRKLGVLAALSTSDKEELLRERPDIYLREVVAWFDPDLLNRDASVLEAGLTTALDGSRASSLSLSEVNVCITFDLLLLSISPMSYYGILNGTDDREAKYSFFRFTPTEVLEFPKTDPLGKGLIEQTNRWLITVGEELESTSALWRTSLVPWKKVIETGMLLFGNRWALQKLAVTSSNIKNRGEVGAWIEGSWDRAEQIADRMRYARLRSSNLKWWSKQFVFQETPSDGDLRLRLLVFFLFAKPKVLCGVCPPIEPLIDGLSPEDWTKTFEALSELLSTFDHIEAEPILEFSAPIKSQRLYALLGRRFGNRFTYRLCEDGKLSTSSQDILVQALVAEAAVYTAVNNASMWRTCLEILKGNCNSYAFFKELVGEAYDMPYEYAEEVLKEPDFYANAIINAAHRSVASTVGMSAQKLAEVAKIEGWMGST